MMGVEMCIDEWNLDSMDMIILLMPIQLFGTEEGWRKLDGLNEQETENIRNAITPNVREIHPTGWRVESRTHRLAHLSSVLSLALAGMIPVHVAVVRNIKNAVCIE